MKKGDIFRWHYKNIEDKFTPYHCCSCIAEFDGKRLRDTFWFGMSEGRSWTAKEAELILNLDFIANRSNLVEAKDDAELYYRPEDIVNLRHANSSTIPLYTRCGAVRSKEIMKETLARIIEKSKRDIEWATRRITEANSYQKCLDAGHPLDNIYLPSIKD